VVRVLDGREPGAIRAAADALRRGDLVAFPTETVYGLGADALNPIAVARIFEAKGRPRFDPIIVHLARAADVARFAGPLSGLASRLAARFSPGPLTLVLQKRPAIPDIVTAGLDTVALRVPDHPVALALLREFDGPIAAPSANPFGTVSPTTAQHVVEGLGDALDLVLDGGPCRVGIESTVVAFEEGKPVVLRPGGIPTEDLESVVGEKIALRSSGPDPRSPGTLPRHYAPSVPVRLVAADESPPPPLGGERRGLLVFRTPPSTETFEVLEVLSPAGDLREAAANLFGALRRLDRAGLDVVYAQSVPEEGLGRAILDRLRRASRRGDSEGPIRGGSARSPGS
jgi:L-threonylcarbamoyladenylate synthase